MKTLYRIVTDPRAPKLDIDMNAEKEFGIFDGSPKANLSWNNLILAKVDGNPKWNSIIKVAPGAFAVLEDSWLEHDDIYYVLEMGNELLAAGNSIFRCRIVNPTTVVPNSQNNLNEIDWDSFYSPIFRIKNFNATDLFCISGTSVSGDEFKYTYDKFGFSGLVFEEIWSGD